MMQNIGAPNYMQPSPTTSAINTQIYNPQAMAAPQPQAPQMMPGVQNPIYSYPQASLYQPAGAAYPQSYQPAPTTSAVNIQIFEPKAYSGAPQPQMPQYSPYMMPQAPYMAPQMMPQSPYMTPPMAPQFTPYGVPQPVMQPVPTPLPVQTPIFQLPQQPMPAPTLPQEPVTVTPEQPQPAVDTVQPTEPSQNQADVSAIVAGLQNPDPKAQEDAITKIANLSQGTPDMQNAVLSEPVMMGLANIIRQDTSNLQGPSEAQIAAINKAAAGEQLTPEEEALANDLAPKTAADKNRVIAMFTLAMLQKNQRDEIDRYNQTQPAQGQLPQLNINDLIGYTDIENAARNDGEKEVKLAAIQALSYVARPEDKATVEPVLQTALQDSEPLIQQTAAEALTAMGCQVQMPNAQPQQEQVDVSQMSRKEKRQYKKAQKAAEKEAKRAEKQAQKEAKKAQKAAA